MNLPYWSSKEKPDFDTLVHYTLAYGSFEDCIELIKIYTKEKVKEAFLKTRAGLYSKQAYSFALALLNLEAKDIQKGKYIKNVFKQSIR